MHAYVLNPAYTRERRTNVLDDFIQWMSTLDFNGGDLLLPDSTLLEETFAEVVKVRVCLN